MTIKIGEISFFRIQLEGTLRTGICLASNVYIGEEERTKSYSFRLCIRKLEQKREVNRE